MDDLFLHTLRDIYYAEKKIVKSLPEMVEQATDAGLKRGFQDHLKQTENHVKRKTFRERSMTNPSWTQRSSLRRKPSSTMTAFLCSSKRSMKKKKQTKS
jgi:hypothetical protein